MDVTEIAPNEMHLCVGDLKSTWTEYWLFTGTNQSNQTGTE
jgi:hypothetical protein